MNGEASRLVRSNTDEIIHQQFLAAQNNLDDVLVMAEELDELEPVDKKKDDEGGCLPALAELFYQECKTVDVVYELYHGLFSLFRSQIEPAQPQQIGDQA